MPWITCLLTKADRNTNYHRRGELRKRSPAHCTTIVDLLCCRIGILTELNFRHWLQPCDRHTDSATDDTLLRKRCIEHTIDSVLDLEIDRRTMNATLDANILTKDEQLLVRLELCLKRLANCVLHV